MCKVEIPCRQFSKGNKKSKLPTTNPTNQTKQTNPPNPTNSKSWFQFFKKSARLDKTVKENTKNPKNTKNNENQENPEGQENQENATEKELKKTNLKQSRLLQLLADRPKSTRVCTKKQNGQSSVGVRERQEGDGNNEPKKKQIPYRLTLAKPQSRIPNISKLESKTVKLGNLPIDVAEPQNKFCCSTLVQNGKRKHFCSFPCYMKFQTESS